MLCITCTTVMSDMHDMQCLCPVSIVHNILLLFYTWYARYEIFMSIVCMIHNVYAWYPWYTTSIFGVHDRQYFCLYHVSDFMYCGSSHQNFPYLISKELNGEHCNNFHCSVSKFVTTTHRCPALWPHDCAPWLIWLWSVQKCNLYALNSPTPMHNLYRLIYMYACI